MKPTTASRLLDLARAATHDLPYGVASHGAAIVSYRRARHTSAGQRLLDAAGYDVGTAALTIATGRRAEVLPYVEAILAGCVTRASAEAWIADAPERAKAAVNEGKRLEQGVVCA